MCLLNQIFLRGYITDPAALIVQVEIVLAVSLKLCYKIRIILGRSKTTILLLSTQSGQPSETYDLLNNM